MHFPESRHYIRRVRIGATSPLIAPLRANGYPVEAAVDDARTAVVSFPIQIAGNVRTLAEGVSMREQLDLAALLQRHWADNQVFRARTIPHPPPP